MAIDLTLAPRLSRRSVVAENRLRVTGSLHTWWARYGGAVLGLSVVLVGIAATAFDTWSSVVLVVPVVVAAGLFLPASQMYAVFIATAVTVALAPMATSVDPAPALTVAVLMVMLLLVGVERGRAATGLPQGAGHRILMDLRDRLHEHGQVPRETLPAGWRVDSTIQAAHGDAFSGDFLVSHCAADRLELALVDVGGKGVDSGSRALLMSGAYSGLIGVTQPKEFLPAANDYLVRQGWVEGYATAIHVHVDLASGDFCVGSGGHPAAMHFQAGSGRWVPVSGEGMMLGVLGSDDVQWSREVGRLGRGDALLLVTDGVVEQPGVDLSQGFDRVLCAAERMMATHGDDLSPICAVALSGEDDDRSVVLVRRS